MDIAGVEISVLGVLVAAVVSFVLGSVWYSPMLFGKQWQKLTGVSMQGGQADIAKVMVGGFAIGLVLSFFFAFTASLAALPMGIVLQNDSVVVINIAAALLLWVGFILVPSMYEILYTKKSLKLAAIDLGYQLVNLVGIAIALGVVA
jgi:hypothetical protein